MPLTGDPAFQRWLLLLEGFSDLTPTEQVGFLRYAVQRVAAARTNQLQWLMWQVEREWTEQGMGEGARVVE